MVKVFDTERMVLRVFTPADAVAAQQFWGDEKVMEFAGGAAPHAVLPQVLASYQNCHLANGLSVYGVIEKDSNEMIGAAGFNIHETLDRAELIYHFAQKSWGKGYATEAVHACVALAQTHPECALIHASAAPDNQQSLKILEKAGFRYQGMKWFEDSQQEEPYYEMHVER